MNTLTKLLSAVPVPFAMMLSCGSPAEEDRAPECSLEMSLSGGGTQHVAEGSPVGCGAGYGPGIVEIGFTVHAGSPVRRFIFQVPDLATASVGATIPAHLRLLPSATDSAVPGWFAEDCSATVERIRVQQNSGPATIAYVTAYGACSAPAKSEPGNPEPKVVVGSFRFTGIAGWNN